MAFNLPGGTAVKKQYNSMEDIIVFGLISLYFFQKP